MASEITVICMDTSSWMQNNRSPRFLAQAEAIQLYCKEKIDFHPENRVGILAMGDKVNKLVEPTRDLQKIMSSIHGAQVDNDSMSIFDALAMADEFLGKNIMYKRIVVFAGGPVYWFKHDLGENGMKLKEKGVAVDVVNFGDKIGPKAGLAISDLGRIGSLVVHLKLGPNVVATKPSPAIITTVVKGEEEDGRVICGFSSTALLMFVGRGWFRGKGMELHLRNLTRTLIKPAESKPKASSLSKPAHKPASFQNLK
nr:26S proteasome non-ATPase regulatory subunit 4 homolog [Tanacetum cinerariifolium]